MKQEILEEAAERLYPTPKVYELYSDIGNSIRREAFIAGVKWQQERMYSEEDMKDCWNASYVDAMSLDEITYKPLFFEDYIEKLKKDTK
jgi:hypothetical protein